MSDDLQDRLDQADDLGVAPIQITEELRAVRMHLADLVPANVLELGAARGGWCYAVAPVCSPGARFIMVDATAYPERERAIRELYSEGYVVHWIQGYTRDACVLAAARAAFAGQPVDVLHIDADHRLQPVLDDWSMYSTLVRPGGIVIFHDALRPDYGVGRAIHWIRTHDPPVTCWTTIRARDPRTMGIVIARMAGPDPADPAGTSGTA